MANAEQIKKELTDAAAAQAVAALEKQVQKAQASYQAMGKDLDRGAAEGGNIVAGGMKAAAVSRPMTQTAGTVMQTAAADAKAENRILRDLQAEKTQANAQYLGALGQKNADQLQQRAAQAKAETLAQYGDFSGYGEQGYNAEQQARMKNAYDQAAAKEDTFTGLGKYAQTLLDLYEGNAAFDIESNLQQALDNGLITEKDYQAALIAARGIVAGSKGKKPGKGSGAGKASDLTPEEQAAAGRMTARDDGKMVISNTADWEVISNYYKRNGQLAYFAENYVFEPAKRADTIYVQGYGDLTWEEAEQLENRGLITVTEDANGNIVATATGASKDSMQLLR